MIIHIDPHGPPPFEQIRSQIVAAIEARTLLPGERLPTVRRLAADLSLAVNTVGRAYRTLEQSGLIITRGRSGSFVAPRELDTRFPVSAHTATQLFTAELVRLDLGLADGQALLEIHWPKTTD